jgi:deoxyribodipyrimidine photo-lyase
VQELGWRAWWHHAWRHRGEAIFASLHAGPMPEQAYARELPPDVRRGWQRRTRGRPGRAHAVARAATCTTTRACGWPPTSCTCAMCTGVPAQTGCTRHLLDGDLASNHLSWQWIAGTGSHQPYLFNADNVARYAPESWHSFDTVVDASYEASGRAQRGGACLGASRACRPARRDHRGFVARRRAGLRGAWRRAPAGRARPCPSPMHRPSRAGRSGSCTRGRSTARRGICQPARSWQACGSTSTTPAGPGARCAGRSWAPAWTPSRRRSGAARRRSGAGRWPAPAAVRGWQDPHLGALGPALGLAPRAAAFAEPPGPCRSFSQFWRAVRYAD